MSATAPTSRPSLLPPTTRPAPQAVWQAPALDGEFSLLSTRSMFLHGRPPPVRPDGASASTSPSNQPGQGMVLRGVARQGEMPMALIEDLAAGHTREIHVGDLIGGCKVVAITPDGFDRTLDGKTSHVKVGQSVDGSAPAMPMPPQPAIAASVPAAMEQASTIEAPLTAGAKILPNKE